MAKTRAWRGWASLGVCGTAALLAAACGSDDDATTTAADAGADASHVSMGDDDDALDASGGPDANVSADATVPPSDGSTLPDASSTSDAGDAGLDAGLALNHLSFDGMVNAITHVGSSWYLGGSFTRASRYPASNILPLDTTGTPTSCPLGTSFDGRINAVAQAGTSIYVGGEFTHYQGIAATRIAKIDQTTCALDTTFSPNMVNNGFDAEPSAFAVSGTSLYVGGQFSAYRGVADSANHLAKLDLTTGALDTTFGPNGPTANGFDDDVDALVVTNGSLYVGGAFTVYRNGAASSARHLAKLDLASGALDTTFSPAGSTANGFNGTVFALAASDTALYVGGGFTAYKNTASSANLVAKLNPATGAIDTTFSPVGATANGFTGPSATSAALALVYANGSLYVGGRFTAYKGTAATGTANRVAKLDATTGAIDTTFSPSGVAGVNGFDNTVEALATDGTSLYVGGLFGTYRNVTASAHGLAKLSLATGAQDATFLPAGDSANGVGEVVTRGVVGSGEITSAVFAGSTLWIAGNFTVYGGASVNGLAKLDDATYAVDTSFSPVGGNGVNGAVYALASSGTSLYVGGQFSSYRGSANNAVSLAKVDLASGALDTTFSPVGALKNGVTTDGAVDSGQVLSLAATATSLYVGGLFDTYRGVAHSANNLAKVDLSTGALDTTFSPVGTTANGFDSAVEALAIAGTSVYAGGDFNMYKGVAGSAHNLAKLDATSGALDTAFSPVGASANGFDNVVFALATSGTSLYVGGNFDTYRGAPNAANNLAKIDLTSGALDTTFSPPGATANGFGTSGEVNALAIANGSLYIGGGFTDYRGVANATNGLAKVDLATGALDTVFSPAPTATTTNGVDGTTYAIGVSPRAVAFVGQFSLYRGGPALHENFDVADPTSGAPLE